MARRAVVAGLALAAAVAAGTTAVAPAGAGANPVADENARPGTTLWRRSDAPAPAVEAYASRVSAAPGDTVELHVSTNPVARYRVEVFRLGWYGGAGGRRVACVPSCTTDVAGAARPAPAPEPNGRVVAGWPVTDSFTVGTDWVSGYFVANVVLTTGSYAGRATMVPFVVKADAARQSAAIVQAAVNTWQAYNPWGGKSLYGYNSTGGQAAWKVSFDRPFRAGYQWFLDWEYPLVRYLEREGIDVAYTTDVDTHREGSELRRHRAVILAGHGEYWTKEIRDALDQARDAGVNLAFMGANTGYWQMRYEDDERTIVEYRSASADPQPDPALDTVRFRHLVPARPECRLLGVQFGAQRAANDPPRAYTVNAAALSDPWFEGTGFVAGDTLPDLVGYEWDALSTGCISPAPTVLFQYVGAPANAHAVRWTAPSGARIFSAGSLQFAWALDDWGGHSHPASPKLQRFMRNVLADVTGDPPPPPTSTSSTTTSSSTTAPSAATTTTAPAGAAVTESFTGTAPPGVNVVHDFASGAGAGTVSLSCPAAVSVSLWVSTTSGANLVRVDGRCPVTRSFTVPSAGAYRVRLKQYAGTSVTYAIDVAHPRA